MSKRIRYRVRYVPKFSRWIIVIAVLAVMLAIAVAANLDYQVMQHAPYVAGQQAASERYGFWFNFVLFMFGFVPALLLGYLYRASKAGVVLFGTIVVATAIVIFANFEDCMYFLLGQRSFPANNVNWNWMWQANAIGRGFWNTSDQILWTVTWLIVLSLFLMLVLKFAKRYEH